MADWVTISSLATASGTLVLAAATFAATRAANRAARVAEESLLAGTRPLLMPSRLDDSPLEVGFAEGHHVMTPGGGGTAEVADGAIYLTMSMRNVGSGIAVLHGWHVEPSPELARVDHPALDDFRRLTRDLYVAAGDVAFWQGAIRDPAAPEFSEVSARITAPELLAIDLLYGDHQGNQRIISRFVLSPGDDGAWHAAPGRHWNVDRPDPR